MKKTNKSINKRILYINKVSEKNVKLNNGLENVWRSLSASN